MYLAVFSADIFNCLPQTQLKTQQWLTTWFKYINCLKALKAMLHNRLGLLKPTAAL